MSKYNKKNTREHKDVTCAVRIPPSLYAQLQQAAEITQSSLSDLIREAMIEKINEIKERELERRLKHEKIRAQLAELSSEYGTGSNKRIQDIVDLLEAS